MILPLNNGVYLADISVFNISPVSHHPPISAFFYISPANRVQIIGELRPKSRFLGNSVSTTMEGENRVTLLGKPEDGGMSILLVTHQVCNSNRKWQNISSPCRTCMRVAFCLARWCLSLAIHVSPRTRSTICIVISNSRRRVISPGRTTQSLVVCAEAQVI